MANAKLIHLGKYYYPAPGGMETHLYDLCNQLKDKFDIQVLVANTRAKTVTEKVEGVNVKRIANLGELFSSPICPSFPLHLARLNGSAEAIIQLHLPNPMGHLAYLAAKPAGALIITWHSDIIKQRWLSRLYRRQLIYLLNRADCIVATSPNYIEHSPFLNRFADKCVVVPLGINVKKFETSGSEKVRASLIRERYAEPIILFVGRFTYYKGLEVLLECAKLIKGKILLIGDGPLRNNIKERIRRDGLQNQVFVLDDVSHQELVFYYHACDVFVLPSNQRSEAFGLVQLEAMVCGKPVVSTNLKTGVPWVNQHGKTGLVVPFNHPERLAAAINYLLKNELEKRQLGQNARRRVLENFTLQKVSKKMESVYHQVLNGGIRSCRNDLIGQLEKC